MTYAEQLRHPRWQRRRLEILNRAGFECENCGDAEKTLHVHHKRYRKGAKAWEYSDEELVALCEQCHESETTLQRRLSDALAKLSGSDLEELVGFAEALAAKAVVFENDVPLITEQWPLRSYEHARGFLACLVRFLPPEFVYHTISVSPLSGSDVFVLGSEPRDILRSWWTRYEKQNSGHA